MFALKSLTWNGRMVAAGMLAGLLVAASPAEADAAQEAMALMAGLEREAAAIGSPALAIPEKKQRFRALLHEAFDMPAIVRHILGRHWTAATPAQRQDFGLLFEELMIDSWVARLKDYRSGQLAVARVEGDLDDLSIETLIPRAKDRPVAVVWRAHAVNGRLKIWDIVAEGVSMATTRREEIASYVLYAGGLDNLIAGMRQQVASLTD